MAFSNWAYANQSTSGATRNSGTNGDGNGLFDWLLRTKSNWTRSFHDATTFADVYIPNGGGPSLFLRHDSTLSGNAGLMVARGCESASSFSEASLVDPFPTITQIAATNTNVAISSAANTTTRDFHAVVWETGIIYASKYSGSTDTWEWWGFCKGVPRLASDTTYPWVFFCRNSASVGPNLITAATSASVSAGSNVFFMRNRPGTIKSSRGVFNGRGSGLGLVASACVIAAGDGNSVDREQVYCADGASSTTTPGGSPIIARVAIPHLFAPAHSSLAGVSETDLIPDGAKSFVLLKNASNGILLQTTNNW
jgi:hypothetical protein